ncbi:MAG: chorismate-binding protein [Phycisphaerales bacterium]|nr:chorismate-binding protein [Phycisphaerales bacterium]
MTEPTPQAFMQAATDHDLVPVTRRVLSDHLTPVLAYRRLVHGDSRTDTSFLLESVEVGGSVGRYSIVAAQPALEVTARRCEMEVVDHRSGTRTKTACEDPLGHLRALTDGIRVARCDTDVFRGGWAGWLGYDSVRWLEPESLPEANAPRDDRGLPDLHFGLYDTVVVFDHVDKTLSVTCWADLRQAAPDAAWSEASAAIDAVLARLSADSVTLPAGRVDLEAPAGGELPGTPTTNRADFESAVERCIEYIRAGDIFQVVPSQRFDRVSDVDPFDVYRALRVVNPSPYMIYMQSPDVVLIASSPEILCRVHGGCVTSRPLAGTRKRGVDAAADLALEGDLRGDAKECAEHAMLVDLARNDIGTVCEPGSVSVDRLMDVERYSHVMHLSSTVTGRLSEAMDCWDALRRSLPVGTVSGAPKIRAMQIIDELEPLRRGPYAGGIGCVSLQGDLDIAIALRTIVVPASNPGPPWTYHLQAGAGVVLDSVPSREYDETVNKAAALGRAIDLAEAAR